LGIIVLGKKYPFLSHTFCSGVAYKASHFPCTGSNFLPRGTTAQKKASPNTVSGEAWKAKACQVQSVKTWVIQQGFELRDCLGRPVRSSQ